MTRDYQRERLLDLQRQYACQLEAAGVVGRATTALLERQVELDNKHRLALFIAFSLPVVVRSSLVVKRFDEPKGMEIKPARANTESRVADVYGIGFLREREQESGLYTVTVGQAVLEEVEGIMAGPANGFLAEDLAQVQGIARELEGMRRTGLVCLSDSLVTISLLPSMG